MRTDSQADDGKAVCQRGWVCKLSIQGLMLFYITANGNLLLNHGLSISLGREFHAWIFAIIRLDE